MPLADEKLGELSASLGLVGVPASIVRVLRDLGAAAEGMGVTKIVNGGAMFTRAAMETVIVKLQNEAVKSNDIRTLRELAHALGYLAHKHIITGKVMIDIQESSREEGKSQQNHRNTSFRPGEQVGPANMTQVTVNVQGAEKAAVTVQDVPQLPPEPQKP